jgi:Glycosyl transferases, related to UDP-glucuronosyltransferase
MLGIPCYADQKYNARKITTEGIGLQLPFKDITKQTLLTSINAVLYNTK